MSVGRQESLRILSLKVQSPVRIGGGELVGRQAGQSILQQHTLALSPSLRLDRSTPHMKGQKRKRGNGDDAEIGQGLAGKLVSPSHRAKQARLWHRLLRLLLSVKHHALATLARAAKKAKTFEIQKLVRKIKGAASATGTGTDVSTQKGKPITASQLLELEGVLVALKSLQVEHLASHALRTRLAKDKTGLGANEDVVLFCSHLQEASSNAIDPTIAEGKAQNRVLASKAMADALNDILVNLRKKAGISIVAKSKQSNDKAASAAGSTKDVKGKGKAVAVEHIPAKKSARQSRHASEASTSVSDDGDETSSSEDDLDSDDGDESDATVSHISAEDAPPGADEEFSGFSDNNNDDDDDDNVSIASDSSFPVAAPKKSKKAKEPDSLPASSRKLDKKAKAALDRAPPPTTSAFLPSLAGGYTVGDPDGSVYSYSGDEGPAAIKPERKNRRGQRARQA